MTFVFGSLHLVWYTFHFMYFLLIKSQTKSLQQLSTANAMLLNFVMDLTAVGKFTFVSTVEKMVVFVQKIVSGTIVKTYDTKMHRIKYKI